MTWEPDREKFKVVCQRCGKTDTVDLEEHEGGFFPRGSPIENLISADMIMFDYYLCEKCLKNG